MVRATSRSTHDLFFPPDSLQLELRRRQAEARRKQARAKPPMPAANLRQQVQMYLEHPDLIAVLEWARAKAPYQIKVRAFQADARRRALVDKLKSQG
jgi:hypothetical protein